MIREAGPDDRAQLAEALADALIDEPTTIWAIPDRQLRRPLLVKFFREYLRQHERHGLIWCDHALTGAAVWAPPGSARTGLGDSISLALAAFHRRMILRAPLLAWGAVTVERRQPKVQDFFYLGLLGVAPAGQGQGLGSKLMAPVLELCDADRVGAYLESSKPENIGFYARHGFRVTGEARLPRGPLVPLMYRKPA